MQPSIFIKIGKIASEVHKPPERKLEVSYPQLAAFGRRSDRFLLTVG